MKTRSRDIIKNRSAKIESSMPRIRSVSFKYNGDIEMFEKFMESLIIDYLDSLEDSCELDEKQMLSA